MWMPIDPKKMSLSQLGSGLSGTLFGFGSLCVFDFIYFCLMKAYKFFIGVRGCSPREIRQGEEIAWYADGETIVRNEHNPSIAYAYG